MTTMKYRTHPDFERAAAAVCLMQKHAWKRVGKHVQPTALNADEAATAFALAKDIAASSGIVGGLAVVYQAAAGKVEDGALSEVEYKRLVNWLEDAVDDYFDGKWNPDAVVNELVTTLRRFESDSAAQVVVDGWAKGDSDRVKEGVELVAAASRIGESGDRGGDVRNLDQRIEEVRRAGKFEPLETGYAEVDAMRRGGTNRGCVSCIGGGTGDGKSIALSSQAAVAMFRGLSVGVVSTEIRPYLVTARVDACLFGLEVDKIREDPEIVRPYYEEHGGKLGSLFIKHFQKAPGEYTTMRDVTDWIDEVQDNSGYPLEVLEIDPINRLRPSRKTKGKSYTDGEFVLDEVGQLADDRNLWIVISSHVVRARRGRYWTINDLADSQWIARLCDDVATVNGDGRGGQRTVAWNQCKVREGGEIGIVGPYPAQYAYGRLMPMRLFDVEDPYAGL